MMSHLLHLLISFDYDMSSIVESTIVIILFISAAEISYDKYKYHIEFITWPELDWSGIHSGFENDLLFDAGIGLINYDECTDWDNILRNVESDSFWYVVEINNCQAFMFLALNHSL